MVDVLNNYKAVVTQTLLSLNAQYNARCKLEET